MTIQEKFDLSGKTVIVTGASKGIGLAMAQACGEAGANVVISSRKQEACDQEADRLKQSGNQLHRRGLSYGR